MNVPIFSIEGGIGAGKSTLLREFQEKLPDMEKQIGQKVVVMQEPVHLWTKPIQEGSTKTKSMLELFYEDNKRYALAFQLYALKTRFDELIKMRKDNPDKIIVCERCPISDFKVFATMLYDAKILGEHEMLVYSEWYDMMTELLQLNICGIVYVRVPASTCAERIIKRDRKGEGSITMDYLHDLEQVHERWLMADPPLVKPLQSHQVYCVEFKEDGHADLTKVCRFIRDVLAKKE